MATNDPASTALQPRPHHYRFVYRWMPAFVFGDPRSAAICRSTKEQLLVMWRIAGEHYAPDAIEPSDGLDAELLPFGTEADLLLITLPPPRFATEAYYVGIVTPRPHNKETIRFFVLSHSDANMNAGMAPGCIREITSDGKNFRSMDFVTATKYDFIVAMQKLCGDQASGSFCVVPATRKSVPAASILPVQLPSRAFFLDKIVSILTRDKTYAWLNGVDHGCVEALHELCDDVHRSLLGGPLFDYAKEDWDRAIERFGFDQKYVHYAARSKRVGMLTAFTAEGALRHGEVILGLAHAVVHNREKGSLATKISHPSSGIKESFQRVGIAFLELIDSRFDNSQPLPWDRTFPLESLRTL